MKKIITSADISKRLKISVRAAQRLKKRLKTGKFSYISIAEFFSLFYDDNRTEMLKNMIEERVSGDERRRHMRSCSQFSVKEELLL